MLRKVHVFFFIINQLLYQLDEKRRDFNYKRPRERDTETQKVGCFRILRFSQLKTIVAANDLILTSKLK